MKTKWIACIFLMSLIACQKKSFTQIESPDNAIVGGSPVGPENPLSHHVVQIVDQTNSLSCTAVIISRNLVLTAAHCIPFTSDHLTLIFGANPSAEKYETRKSDNAIAHPSYNNTSMGDRNDLALVSFSGGLPVGFTPALLPDSGLALNEGQAFMTLGYGRTSGRLPQDPQDMQGSNILRAVSLSVESFTANHHQFEVNQSYGRGICAGDSGGPAFLQRNNNDYVMGIASAVIWMPPQGLTEAEQKYYQQQMDVCAEKSIYIDVSSYLPWIREASRMLFH
ncbi:MAG TPA: trypsin-like serine protease [Bdellovibrio sp.]|nr:trypsin-like serine protease [Bdellovibrio sp.]